MQARRSILSNSIKQNCTLMKKGEEDSEVIVDEQDNTGDGSSVENFLHDIEEDEISKLK